MLRNIVRIDSDKCNGCGQCVTACVEGAIELVNGKARLVKDSYCDGLGACLGHCPMDAITVEKREAAEFDEKAAAAHAGHSAPAQSRTQPCEGLKKPSQGPAVPTHAGHACPGSAARRMTRKAFSQASAAETESQLANWPVQLTLTAANAEALQGADLLLAADCAPFALAGFHSRLLRGRALLIACPKLDDAQAHLEKLSQVLAASDVRSLTVARMEVPCCSGLTRIAQAAIGRSGKQVPFREIIISIEGKVLDGE